MNTPESQWNADAPPQKSSNRKLWWILGCAGFAVLGFITLGIVATIVVPNVLVRHRTAQETKIRVDLTLLNMAVEEYRLNHKGTYPASWNDLVVSGKTLPQDPWGHDYVFVAGEDLLTRPRLFTYGRDGAPGGEGDDADIEYDAR